MRLPVAGLLACLAASLAAGCGGKTTTLTGPEGNVPCTVTLTGAVSKVISGCTAAASLNSGQFAIGISAPAAADNIPEFAFSAKSNGTPTTGTYMWGNTLGQNGEVYEGASQVFLSSETGSLGVSQYDFTTLAPFATSGTATVYTVHGTLTATLDCTTSGCSGTVTATVSF